MYEYLLKIGVPMFIVLAKIDRLNTSATQKSVNHTRDIIPGQPIFTTSSKKNIGIKELFKALGDELEK